MKLNTADQVEKMKCALSKNFPDRIDQLSESASKILEAVADKPSYILSVVESLCRRRIDVSNMPNITDLSTTSKTLDPEKFKNEVSLLFSRPHPQPIGVSVDMETYCRPAVGHFLHAMTVVGREFNQGKCEIILRAGFGTSCSGLGHAGVTYQYPCTDGILRVPLQDLANSTVGMTWIGD